MLAVYNEYLVEAHIASREKTAFLLDPSATMRLPAAGGTDSTSSIPRTRRYTRTILIGFQVQFLFALARFSYHLISYINRILQVAIYVISGL